MASHAPRPPGNPKAAQRGGSGQYAARAHETLLASGKTWAMGWVAPVLFTLFYGPPSEDDFAAFLSAAAEDIDQWPSWSTRSVLHHATASASLSAAQRQATAEMVKAREEQLRQICQGYVFCSRSGLSRGVIKVINWLAPPPYPAFQAESVAEGLKMLRSVDARVQPDAVLARYAALFAQFLPGGSADS
jgi:hypothetical protein